MARYSCQVDWLSLVFPTHPYGDGAGEGFVGEGIARTLRHEIGEALANDLFAGVQPLGYGRSPYAFGWQDVAHGLTIWAGGDLSHFTVEFSGQGVAYLREIGAEAVLIEAGRTRASRLDIAVDLEQGVEPEEFLKYRKDARQQTFSSMTSTGGKTCYVGSRHSERYLRVYRYAAPHPRSHLLRIETVLKRAYAKQGCSQILEAGLEAVSRACMEDFGFGGLVDFDESVQAADLSIYRPERNGGKTLRWLITQVAPSFVRLVREGAIPDAREFLERYFLNPLEEE